MIYGAQAIVGITETCERLALFYGDDAETNASKFIGTLAGHEQGIYYLDVDTGEA